MKLLKKALALLLATAMVTCMGAATVFAEGEPEGELSGKAIGISGMFERFDRKGQPSIGVSSITFNVETEKDVVTDNKETWAYELAVYPVYDSGIISGGKDKNPKNTTNTSVDNELIFTVEYINGNEAYLIKPKRDGTANLTYTAKNPGNDEVHSATIEITIKGFSEPPNDVVAGLFVAGNGSAPVEELTSMNPENIPLTGDNAEPYTFDSLNGAMVFVTGSDGKILTTPLTADDITVEPAESVVVKLSNAGDSRFFLRPYKGATAKVTVRGQSSFTVSNPYEVINGTTYVPTLVYLNDDGALTSGMYANSESYPPRGEGDVHLINYPIGVAFIDISEESKINNAIGYKSTVTGFSGVDFALEPFGDKPLMSQDKVERKGIHPKSKVHWADATTNSNVEWRSMAVTADVTVNGKSYTAKPYKIIYGAYADSSDRVDVPFDDEDNKIIYISSVNSLIKKHAITEAESKKGVAAPSLRFPDGARIVAGSDNIDTITIPVDCVIELFGPNPGQGQRTDIYGSITIAGNGSNDILLYNLSLHGNKDIVNNAEANKSPRRKTAIGGMGVANVGNCNIDGYDVGIDMSLVDENDDGRHDGTFNRSASKGTNESKLSNCGVGMIIGTHIQNALRGSIIENCTTGIALMDQVTTEYSLVFIRGNSFRGNTTDMTYDQETEYRIYATQNYFQGKDGASRKPIFTGNLQCSPYYMDSELTILAADLDNAKTSDGNYDLPVDTSADGGMQLSQTVINDFKAVANASRSVAVPSLVIPLRSGSDMNATPDTIWNFAKDNLDPAYTGASGIAFNLAVDKNIAAFGGTVGAYEPISFKHHNKLPGTAAISIKKTAALDTSKTLMLYKLEGRTPVKQPEAVTVAGEMLVFNRDTCSDYLITDTDIAIIDNSGNNNSNSSSGGSGGSNGYTSSEDIADKLDKATGDNVSISVSSKPNVAAGAFDVLKNNPNKTLTFKGDSYSWSFKGSDILARIPGLIAINTSISTISPNSAAVQMAAGSATIQNVYFSHHGQLPGKATIELVVEQKFAGKALNLYYFNAATGKLSLVHSGLKQKDGKVSFTITHCSDYLLTPDTIADAGMANPETGAKDIIPAAIAITVISLLGSALLAKKTTGDTYQ